VSRRLYRMPRRRPRVAPRAGPNPGLVVLLAALTFASAVTLTATAIAARPSALALPTCRSAQLKLSGRLTGATQSLFGLLTLRNRSGRACALPPAPYRVSLYADGQLLPTLTVRMKAGHEPRGTPTRVLPGQEHVLVALRWRNWCGAPRGAVRLVLVLALFRSATPHLAAGLVRTPPCIDHRFSSTVAVSRFIRR
jgi:Protein of unknown function (DUF4232)